MEPKQASKNEYCAVAEHALFETPTQLFFDAQTVRALRLCGMAEERITERASDFERFSALTEALPLLVGHPVRTRCALLLKELLGIPQLPTVQTRDQIWREAARKLLHCNVTANDVQARLSNASSLADETLPHPSTLPVYQISASCERLFPCNLGASWRSWCENATQILDVLASKKGQHIAITLSKDYLFQKPDLYHVNRHLGAADPNECDPLWKTQLLRFVCEACQSRRLTLILHVKCKGSEAVRALSYTKETVGLPRMIWTAACDASRDTLLAFQAELPNAELFFALPCQKDTPTDWQRVFSDVACVYPIGRMILVQDNF